MTKTALAAACHVSLPTIAAWISKGCPSTQGKDGRASFDLKKVTQWRAATMPTRALLPTSYSVARARKETALAGLREIQLRVRQGEVVEVSAVKRELFAVSRPIRDRLENIPARMAGIVAAESSQEKCFELLRREVQQALEALTHEDNPTTPTKPH